MNIQNDLRALYDNSVLWQMSVPERIVLKHIVQSISKDCVAIEVGSYCGGSLRDLSKCFKKVYSCDVNHDNIKNTSDFKNVEFIKGDSKKELPFLIKEIALKKEELGFILIDGDHEYEGLMGDLEAILEIIPMQDVFILVHDSWYTPSRKALLDTYWNKSEYISFIDLDFCGGNLVKEGLVMGGFALIVMSKNKIHGKVEILQSQKTTLENLLK